MKRAIRIDDVALFVVTGRDRTGKRFRIETTSHDHWIGINVWQGSKWVVLKSTGKRLLMARIVN